MLRRRLTAEKYFVSIIVFVATEFVRSRVAI
jgi:hypothetical protein